MILTIAPMYSLSRSTTSAGSFSSQKAVKPRMSENRIVTSWRVPESEIFWSSEMAAANFFPTKTEIAVWKNAARFSAERNRYTIEDNRLIRQPSKSSEVESMTPNRNRTCVTTAVAATAAEIQYAVWAAASEAEAIAVAKVTRMRASARTGSETGRR